MRLTWSEGSQEHHLTIPLHRPLKVGILAGVLKEVSQVRNLTREELLKLLDL
ncbi:MAG: hypothetical protein ACK41R_03545 [Thermus sp.]